METHTLSIVHDNQLSEKQRAEFFAFEQKCFEKDLTAHRRLLYFSQPFAHIFIEDHGKLISYLRVFVRQVQWNKQSILIGGVGSVATEQSYRGQGIATQLLREAMQLLHQQHVSFAVLQTYIPKGGKLYERVGFYPAQKGYTFLDSNNQLHTVKAQDVMVAPVENPSLLEEIIGSQDLLHLGKGDW